MKIRSIRRYAGALACAAPWLAHAQAAPSTDSVSELPTITVTALRVPTAEQLPTSISVISAADIAASSARTMQDLLSTQTGVHLINTSSSTDTSIVDLRGFGLTGASNTLIMIDGARQNDNDLSAPSLGNIPLMQVERIEIVRGSGSVQYGGGTTGGVINIITKKDFSTPVAAQATITAGSFGLRQLNAAVAFNNEKVGVDAFMQSLNTDNYRDNNKERRDGGGAGLTFRHDDGLIRLYGRSTNQKLGLPGPRLVDPFTGVNEFDSDPRGAKYPNDFLKTRSDAYGVQFEQRLGAGTLYADLNQRNKELDGYSDDSYDIITRHQELAETTASARYKLPFGTGHTIVVGLDSLDSTTNAHQESGFGGASQWRSKQNQYGLFAEGQIRATDSTLVTLGARRQYASDDLDVLAGSGTPSDQSRHLNAWQLGLRQELAAGFGAYAKIGRSFRLPNADELLSVQTPLQAQTSTDKELGLTWADEATRARLSWFRYDLNNEISYNPLADGLWGPGTGANTNLSPTRRQGVELEAHHALSKTLTLDVNATWLKAEFRSGSSFGVDLRGNRVPLVPQWLANAGVSWRPDDAWLLSMAAQYVGSARMDNDQANQFATKLDDYVLVNGKVSYRFSRTFEGSLGVNNLFDRKYASYGIRGGNADFAMLGPVARYNLYPAPGRSFYASLTARY